MQPADSADRQTGIPGVGSPGRRWVPATGPKMAPSSGPGVSPSLASPEIRAVGGGTPHPALVPRLAKLKEASLARRRQPLVDYNAAVQQRELPALEERPSAADDDGRPATSMPSRGEALSILEMDGASQPLSDLPISRLRRLQAARALATDGGSELPVLRRRLRHAAAQLAFHEANAARQCHSSTVEDGPAMPWLPGNTSAGSKHRAAHAVARAPSRGGQERVRDPRPSPQTSELQVKLLTALVDRLRLKIGLQALGEAARASRLRAQLVDRVAVLEDRHLLSQMMGTWSDASLPANGAVEAAAMAAATRTRRVASSALQAWRSRTVESRLLRDSHDTFQAAQSRRLVAAALAHWRLAAVMGRLKFLRRELAEGWEQAWGVRKALLAWRRTASWRRQQREALLAAAQVPRAPTTALPLSEDCGDHIVPGAAPVRHNWRLEACGSARAAARAELEGLRTEVAAVAAGVPPLRSTLRWCDWHGAHDPFEGVRNKSMRPWERPDYDPAAYSSPVKRPRGPAAAAAADLAAELFAYREEAEAAEARCNELRYEMEELERAVAATAERSEAVAAEEDAAAAAVQAAERAVVMAEEHENTARVAAEACCSGIQSHRVALERILEEATMLRGAAQAADAALASAREEVSNASAAARMWMGKVSAAASALARAPVAAKSAAALQLREARGRLEAEQRAAEAADTELPELMKKAEAAAEEAQASEAALAAAQQAALSAAAAEASAASRLKAATAAAESARDDLKKARAAAEHAAADVEAAREAAAAQRAQRRRLGQQLLTLEREAAGLRDHVAELDERHALAVAEALEEQRAEWVAAPLALLPPQPLMLLPALEEVALAASSHYRSPLLLETASEGASAAESPLSTPPCSPWAAVAEAESGSLSAAARHLHACRLSGRTLKALRRHAALWRGLHSAAAVSYCLAHLPAAFRAWRQVTADAAAVETVICENARALTCLRAWKAHVARCSTLRSVADQVTATRAARVMAGCFTALRAHAATQQYHRDVLEAAEAARVAAVLRSWRTWAAASHRRNETLAVALERRRLRSMQSAIEVWRSNASAAALLRRVFTAAAERWQSCVGAAGLEAEAALLQRCLTAWQLAAHAQAEERRQGALVAAADGNRRRRLLAAAFEALRAEAAWARDREMYAPLARVVLLAWRAEAVGEGPYAAAAAAVRQRADESLMSRAFEAWTGAATATACRVSLFYLKWQADAPARRALHAWRAALAERRRWEERRAEAEAMRARNCSKKTTPSPERVSGRIRAVVVAMPAPQPSAVCSTGAQPSTAISPLSPSAAHSIGPVYSEAGPSKPSRSSPLSWEARAAEWRSRQALYIQ